MMTSMIDPVTFYRSMAVADWLGQGRVRRLSQRLVSTMQAVREAGHRRRRTAISS